VIRGSFVTKYIKRIFWGIPGNDDFLYQLCFLFRVSVTLLNGAGTLVRSIVHEYGKGHTKVAIDITDHAPGVYFCYVKQGRIAQMIRIIKNQ
jgi:hypothetical protein